MTDSPAVLIVTTVHDPRDARIAVRQIDALVRAGCRVTYAAPFAARGASAPPGVCAVELPRSHGRDRLSALGAARRTLRRLSPANDVVLLHDPELLLAAPWRHSTATIVWDVHEDAPAAVLQRDYLPRVSRRLIAAVLRALERVAERRVSLLLAESGYRRRFRDPHPVIRNVPVVPETVGPPRDDRVVYLGRLSRDRGAREMIELGRRVPSVEVQVVGWADDDVADVVARAARSGLVTSVGQGRFVENRVALGLLEGASAGLSLLHDLPNYRSSLPTKVIEYMAHGLPVITTPLPEAVALVERAACGIVVPFGDVSATVDAVTALIGDRGMASDMGARGHALVRREFNWSLESDRFVELIRGWAS